MYQSRNIGTENQTMSITYKFRIPTLTFSLYARDIVQIMDAIHKLNKKVQKYRDISGKKKVKFVAHKLKKSAWDCWEQLHRMRTRLRKDPIESWEKMKKHLKRQFLPPDYHEIVYQKYENCRQFGNSVSDYTKEFSRLRSYLDFNESEAYSISRYKMGLRWAICKRLSSRSFYYLYDIVAAAASEKLVEREKTLKWKPHSPQHTSTEYPVVITTQKYSSTLRNSRENTSTLSSKVSGDEREYGHNTPSKRIATDFVDVIKDEDHAVR